jgi:3-dehydroquinate synthase
VNKQYTLTVDLGPRSYEIVIGHGQLTWFSETLQRWAAESAHLGSVPGSALVVTDDNVANPHAEIVTSGLQQSGWKCGQTVLEPGEQTKSLAGVSRVYDELVALKADRKTIVVAVGGGVIGDLAGFAAATFARGVPFVQVPTTLLADVDSSVGGKVGINHPQGKNLIGAFHQPLGVFIDPSVLDSLPIRDYRSGLAEVIKYGVILEAEFFEYLEANIEGLNARAADVLQYIIRTSCRLKASVVEQDEFERTGLRAILNYGHTFAHAFEALCGYGELLHGEAVAIGMVCASRLAERRGLIDAEVTDRQIALLEAVGLPTQLPATIAPSADAVLDRMYLDKKTVAGQLRFVLPTKLGHVDVFKDIDANDVRSVL